MGPGGGLFGTTGAGSHRGDLALVLTTVPVTVSPFWPTRNHHPSARITTSTRRSPSPFPSASSIASRRLGKPRGMNRNTGLLLLPVTLSLWGSVLTSTPSSETGRVETRVMSPSRVVQPEESMRASPTPSMASRWVITFIGSFPSQPLPPGTTRTRRGTVGRTQSHCQTYTAAGGESRFRSGTTRQIGWFASLCSSATP